MQTILNLRLEETELRKSEKQGEYLLKHTPFIHKKNQVREDANGTK